MQTTVYSPNQRLPAEGGASDGAIPSDGSKPAAVVDVHRALKNHPNAPLSECDAPPRPTGSGRWGASEKYFDEARTVFGSALASPLDGPQSERMPSRGIDQGFGQPSGASRDPMWIG